ncbi:SGNH/GDSL hydrolase family protein [Mucilaginibacter sp. BJC16-A38]|uniref:SGNH/GDSL hydrolase family protein n=1 Tax=Mucilaginibacter phenanthrenivorans TaxID=1234842 RepID=UPI0021579E30|nr:SGNH/GDSL hydrolase family protein [Mucilaginibacter phenanthrenivorans]MCR8558426.1 SGNH/GDSL hydrolase family protein [Mucilaginibacter phenanthrenivorans]
MKILQIILIAVTALSGCTKKAIVPAPVVKTDTTVTTKPMTTPVTYLALGDSYTIGQSVPQIQSFPYQLVSLLNYYQFNVQKPDIIATTGWTTDDLISAISRSDFKDNKYDFVTLLIGVNDQHEYQSKDNYRTKFAQVLQTAINFAKGDASRVFVLSIPDYGVTPYGNGGESIIGPDIDAFNAINREETAKAHVLSYIDITAISRLAATNPSLIADDGLHPSAQMYQMWVQALEPSVKARLEK